jgi:hypothetical protein
MDSEFNTAATMDYIYGPLSKNYCIYFYLLSVVGFVLLCFAVLSAILVGFTKQKSSGFYVQMLMICIGYGIFYFQNRLLYSMCVGSTKEGIVNKIGQL